MRQVYSVLALVVILNIITPDAILAQSSQGSSVAVPRLINIGGVFRPADGQPAGPTETVTLSVYADEEGGEPLWQETQSVAIDPNGRYAVLLGATQPDGIPAGVFASGAQWLGTRFDRAGEVEARRVRLTSVPYALRSADADTLGGHPASAYVLAPTAGDPATRSATAADQPTPPSANLILPGTPNVLAKYVNAGDVGDSAVYESGGRVGIGTTGPADLFHVRFTNTNGTLTGMAVQNLGNTATSYSGTLFYDQNGLLGQFQGFNNVTHEYRINNVARNAVTTNFDGSINFMIGGISKFYVSPVTVGIGTTLPSPTANLDVSNAVSGSGTTNVNVTTYSANGFGPNLIGRKARGTQSAPTAVLNNDALLLLSGNGHGATAFAAANSASIAMRTSEDWTDAAQGSYMSFSTTANGTTTPITRLTINQNGNVGIGVFGAQAGLEVSNSNGASGAGTMMATTFANAGTSLLIGRRARGTGIAPTAVQNGDNLAGFLASGYGATTFSGTRGGMFVQAAETWTDAAQGTRLNFNTTIPGSTATGTRMTLDPFGNLGIGTSGPQAALEIVRQGGAEFLATTYSGASDSGEFNVVTRTARGTPAAPAAVQAGDELGGFAATGYGTTGFGEFAAGFAVFAAENWTDAAQGAGLVFGTTPLGSNEAQITMVTLPNGNVGIGQPVTTDFPALTDRLEVFGNIRVGTTGTNGCLKDFGGNPLAGTCASDLRLKRDITPFGSVLGQLTALQPVNYFWRAAEFPDRRFGGDRSSGLIAQDVEKVLPDLVETDADGFKAVNYSKLPLLTIQAVKELKAENDALKQRIAELERLVTEIAAKQR
jgi:hypothetical protein